MIETLDKIVLRTIAALKTAADKLAFVRTQKLFPIGTPVRSNHPDGGTRGFVTKLVYPNKVWVHLVDTDKGSVVDAENLIVITNAQLYN